MSRTCELSGKSFQTGFKVSNSNMKTKRRFLSNTRKMKFYSTFLKKSFKIMISSYGLRSINKHGGIDFYLQKARISKKCSSKVRKIARRILSLASVNKIKNP